jgi:uncharacterized integral membrane protein
MTEPPDRPLPLDETAARRRFTARHLVGLALLVFAVVYLVLLIVQNRRKVRFDYVFGSGEHRLIWLIVLSGVLGWLLGVGTSLEFGRRRRRRR